MKDFFRKLWGGTYMAGRRNQAALECLRELGFAPGPIRRALIELNEIRIRKFVNGRPPSVVYQTVKGTRRDKEAMERIAGELGLHVAELFPETVKEAAQE